MTDNSNCQHFGTCGGCALQGRSDEDVATIKVGHVRSALQDRGLDAPIRHVVTSPAFSRRRATFSGRRTKKTTQLGFFERRSERLVNLTECFVVEPAIMDAFDALHLLVRLAATRTSVVRVSVTVSDNGLDVDLRDARDLTMETRIELSNFAEQFARLTWNGEVVLQSVPPAHAVGPTRLVPPPGGFLQATKTGEAALLRGVRDAVGDCGNVLDLYAGSGTFTLPLAETCDVHAVESEAAALTALDQAWRAADRVRQVTTEVRDLFRRPLLPVELNSFDAIVLDPPRAGAVAQVAEIATCDVAHLAMVSCNPATYARDVQTLIDAGYTIDFIDVIDQFRWSNHVEIISGINRR